MARNRRRSTPLRVARRRRQAEWAAKKRARGICRVCPNRSKRFAYCKECRLKRSRAERAERRRLRRRKA